jgi:putative spermidine/putrescine transport system ATP-binding protein
MSDRVAVFNNGRIEQVDAPQDLYLRPKTAFVAGFVGTANVFDSERRPLCGMAGLVAAPGTYSPEQRRRSAGAGRGAGGAVSGGGDAVELKLANGDKLLVSQANSDGMAAARRDRANGAGFVVASGDGAAGKGG